MSRICAAIWTVCLVLVPAWGWSAEPDWTPEQLQFFETSIRPVLVEHCYSCHSARVAEPEGGLRLDTREGWTLGGESGEPAVIPGDPVGSPLLRAMRHENADTAMPPRRPRLPSAVIADFERWVTMGAPDPRTSASVLSAGETNWEVTYRKRASWWSLQPVRPVPVPAVERSEWVRNEVDRFVLAGLEARGLRPSPEAGRETLARRLSFALTGLPPDPAQVARFANDESPGAWERLVRSLLDSPQYGEHWARHWMDVVHYADTHGYEWDAPAKNAWMYRDYLVRAWNADVPVNQLLLEQLAGDLVAPRVDPVTGINEAVIGPMALRLGERRHGDNAAVEGVTQEAVANMIDTVGKGFLGLTLACAQCHDHKLDPVSQQDYYALAGIVMSTRWGVRCADAVDPNGATLARLKRIKSRIRAEVARMWLAAETHMAERLRAFPADAKAATRFPESLSGFWHRSLSSPLTEQEFLAERERRRQHNHQHLKMVADFTATGSASGWRWDGFGMQHGLVSDGEVVVADEGDQILSQILPAGRWTHVWSARLAGALASPALDAREPMTFSVGAAGGRHAAHAMMVDQAFHSERMKFFQQPAAGWLTVTAGNFDTLEGSIDRAERRVHWEMATKALNNYFPPRTGYGGLKESDAADPRSWFGVTRIYEHPPGKPPADELDRFLPLWQMSEGWDVRLSRLVMSAVERWSREQATEGDARLLDDALRAGLLPNQLLPGTQLQQLVERYRRVERQLQPDRTVGSAADWYEGRDERLAIRGSYTDLGEPVPRGGFRLLGDAIARREPDASGRLELALQVVDDANPLTARVFVNRVWLHLFGEGLVRTPDDFGQLGEPPVRPELLDYLAGRFVQEGWSLKRLIRLLVTSATWRQSSAASVAAKELDPENRGWHHYPARRLEAEAIRDAMLQVSGRLDSRVGGPPVDPYRTAEDAAKRLFRGPVDGDGRRSLYTKVTLMEPPRLLAVFNQPLPKMTTGKRDVTNVPAQALTLLNDPFVLAMAEYWSTQVMEDGAATVEERASAMWTQALGRQPALDETARLARLARQSAELRRTADGQSTAGEPADVLRCHRAWQDVAHAIFNLKEFIYVP